jgi:hypothetical protein
VCEAGPRVRSRVDRALMQKNRDRQLLLGHCSKLSGGRVVHPDLSVYRLQV